MSSENPLLDRLPPQNQEAERSVLGSMLRDNQVISDIIPILTKDDFYADAHQKIYETIVELNDKGGPKGGHPVDVVLLAEALKQRGYIEDVGGYGYLAEVYDAAPTAANAEYYARIVRDKAKVRNLIHAGTEILTAAYNQSMPADQLVESAERAILDVAEKGTTNNLTTLAQAIEATYDRIDKRNTGEAMAFSGLSTGFTDLDSLTAGLQQSELIIIAARPSVGKCLAGDSEIVLDDGSVVTIEEVFRRQQGRMLTLDDEYRFAWTAPSAFVDDGCKPVYRVTTRLGRTITATAAHPFLTIDGWQPLAELSPGIHVAVPRKIVVFGNEPLRECEVKLLAYLIGDGGLSDTTPEFTNSNPRLRDEFTQAVQEFGPLKVRLEDNNGRRTPTLCVAADPGERSRARAAFAGRLHRLLIEQKEPIARLAKRLQVSPALVEIWKKGDCVPSEEAFKRLCAALRVESTALAPEGWVVLRKSAQNSLTRWLASLGLWGKRSAEKFVPDIVFRLPRVQLALFLNRLFATDGWASAPEGGRGEVGYSTVSERLGRQVQHLLLRFGVLSRLRPRAILYRGNRRPAWQLQILGQRGICRFAETIGIFGKEAALEQAVQSVAGRRDKSNCDLVPQEIWSHLDRARGTQSWASVAVGAGYPRTTNLHVGHRSLSPARLERLANAVADERLGCLARGDVLWDEIKSIEPLGSQQVYDLTIPETHNFIANDICVHNTAFSLGLARNIVVGEKEPVFFVSLEQSRIEIAERLLCSQAKVDSHRLRTGTLTAEDMEKLIEAGSTLRDAKLFIDDSPAQGMLRIAANARRLHARQGIKLVIIDYLQLIEPDNRRDPRQEQVAQISRRLKFLARELAIPVIALAQVNRASEDRQDHRPRLSDLRESGCLTGDTLVTLADSGERRPIRELVGRSGFLVWALDEASFKLKAAEVSNAFCTGRKPVFRLTTRLGRTIRATANHKFRAFAGWQRLDVLSVGDCIALPRLVPCARAATLTIPEVALLGHLIGDGCTLPRHVIQYTTREADLATIVADLARQVFGETVSPRINRERQWYQVYLTASERLTHGKRNPVAKWLDGLGVFGLRSWEKFVPEAVFRQSAEVVAAFLRHLWATDGCIRAPQGITRNPQIYYASSSERLVRDVQSLLLRLGINAVLRPREQGNKGRRQFHLLVMGRPDVLNFAETIGATGAYKNTALAGCREWVQGRKAKTNRDIIPHAVWQQEIVPVLTRSGSSMRQLSARLGYVALSSSLSTHNLSRDRMLRVAGVVASDSRLLAIAQSDIYWDKIVAIEAAGEEDVFDLTVPGPSNFACEDFIVHNSIEQDADAVFLLHRPDRYEPGQSEGVIEVIVAKNRNGPVGEVTLAYIKQYLRYEDFKVGTPFDG